MSCNNCQICCKKICTIDGFYILQSEYKYHFQCVKDWLLNLEEAKCWLRDTEAIITSEIFASKCKCENHDKYIKIVLYDLKTIKSWIQQVEKEPIEISKNNLDPLDFPKVWLPDIKDWIYNLKIEFSF